MSGTNFSAGTQLQRAFSAICLLIALLPAFSFATEVTLTPPSLSACQCDPLYYQVAITNTERDDVFIMALSSNYAFSTFLQPQIPVPGASTVKSTLVLNTACNAPAGNYSFSVIAAGSHATRKVDGYAIIKACKNLELFVPQQQAVCAGSSQVVALNLKNSGLVNESGKIVLENMPNRFFYLANGSFTLQPGQEKNFFLSIQPPSGTPPATFSYDVLANNARSTAALQIKDCTVRSSPTPRPTVSPTPTPTPTPTPAPSIAPRLDLNLSTQNIFMCAGSRKTFSLNVTAIGSGTTIRLVSSGLPGSFSTPQFTLPVRGRKTVDFTIDGTNLTVSNRTLSIQASSQLSSASGSVAVQLRVCPNIVFGQLELCLGESGSIPFAFKNTNAQTTDYIFNSSSAIPSHIEPSRATSEPNGIVSASIFATGSALGVFPITVLANTSVLSTSVVVVRVCSPVATPAPNASAVIENIASSTPAPTVTLIPTPNATAVPSGPARISIAEKIQETISNDNGTLENAVTFAVTNNGNNTVNLTPGFSALNASFDPATLSLNPGEEKELRASFTAQENQSIHLTLVSQDGGYYSLYTNAVNVPSSPVTGFFTASRAIGFFALVVVAVIVLLAFFLRKHFLPKEEDSAENMQAEAEPQKGKKRPSK